MARWGAALRGGSVQNSTVQTHEQTAKGVKKPFSLSLSSLPADAVAALDAENARGLELHEKSSSLWILFSQ